MASGGRATAPFPPHQAFLGFWIPQGAILGTVSPRWPGRRMSNRTPNKLSLLRNIWLHAPRRLVAPLAVWRLMVRAPVMHRRSWDEQRQPRVVPLPPQLQQNRLEPRLRQSRPARMPATSSGIMVSRWHGCLTQTIWPTVVCQMMSMNGSEPMTHVTKARNQLEKLPLVHRHHRYL